MIHQFQIISLSMKQYTHLFTLTKDELRKHNGQIITVDETPGYPCRVSLMDADIGERVLAIPFVHHAVQSPYQSSGPIFIRENAEEAKLNVNEIPPMLAHRLLSIRAYDVNTTMIEADLINGDKLKEMIDKFFENKEIAYLHIHHAKPGCYSCHVSRVK